MNIGFANIITGVRILCSIALLLCPAFSPSFYILYLSAGLTDMIDGPGARKTGTANELGAKLDTAADFVFAAVCLIKFHLTEKIYSDEQNNGPPAVCSATDAASR